MKKLIYLFLGLLIVACSSDDSSDTGNDTLAIGDSYQGGKIAYIFQSGDTGYVAGETHGLIAATEDQSERIQWYNGSSIITGATGAFIGTGLTNTNAIIAAQGSGSYAASIARDYNGGGYTDWFLPSKDELNQLYENKTAIGGIANSYYWCSTESEFSSAWWQDLSSGYQAPDNKDATYYVRAVRTF